MAKKIDPLVVGKVIGDVLHMFVPAAKLIVLTENGSTGLFIYGSKQVSNGSHLTPSSASAKPIVRITGDSCDPSALYTLVMSDPDAPSPSEPTYREWLHWIVVNISEGGEAREGKELMAYMGPQPPTGIHRYVFSVFKQKEAMERPRSLPEKRNNFSTRQFADENELGLPVAAVYFNSHKEPATKRRYN